MRIQREACGCLFDSDQRAWILDCPRHRFSTDTLERIRLELICRQIAEDRTRSQWLFHEKDCT